MSAVYNERKDDWTRRWTHSNPPFESEARPRRGLDATPQKVNRTWHQIVCFDDPNQYLSVKWVEEVAMGLYVFYDTNFIANNDNYYESIILAHIYI